MLLPLQAASWLMSILEGLGAVPSKVTLPLTVAAVAGSIGADAPPGLASELGEVPCSSLVFSFLLQPVSIPSASTEARKVAAHWFLFMMSPFRKVIVNRSRNASCKLNGHRHVRLSDASCRPASACSAAQPRPWFCPWKQLHASVLPA